MRSLLACLLVLVAAALLFYLWQPGDRASDEEAAEIAELVADAKRYSSQGRFADVVSVAEEMVEKDAVTTEVLLLAGDAAAQMKDYGTALAFFNRIPEDESEDSLKAAYSKGALEFYYGTFARAEVELAELLQRDPSHLEGNQLMSELMDLTGRRWETIPYALEVLRQDEAQQDTLLRLADQEQIVDRLKRMKDANDRDRNDPGPLLGLSRSALWDGQPVAARALVERSLELRPDLVEAHIRLGFLVIDRTPEEFTEWHAKVPKGSDWHPDLWVLRGHWAKANGQLRAAARCFWEAVRRNPNEARGMRQLALLLPRVGRSREEAEKFLNRSQTLIKLRKAIQDIYRDQGQTDSNQVSLIADLMEQLGRKLEAQEWRQLVNAGAEHLVLPQATNAQGVVDLWVDSTVNPAATIDLSEWPLPDFTKPLQTQLPGFESKFAARYEDFAERTGLKFTQIAAPDDTTEGKRIIETLGGGVGVFDIDLDSSPDIFFTQIGTYPDSQPGRHIDRLFRQVDGQFADVTQLAGIRGPEFGQGMAVGDIDADGFPDLFVANLGRNKLYLNNGDGTLTDATASLNDKYQDWSTSAALVDVNGDALPDLYVVNYLSGDGVDRIICNTAGHPTTCGPDAFRAAQDRFFVNKGDGTFEDQTEQQKLVVDNGKGLGVLAADFDEDGSVQFFVANDGVENFMFGRQSDASEFEDLTALSGTSTSGEGIPQGSMGITAGDANQDGLLDLFVTNFDNEHNAMYLKEDGVFEDKIKQAQLADGSLRMVGFGTQFVDGELDGLRDLLVTNGNVADYTKIQDDTPTVETAGRRRVAGVTFNQPTQYFRNTGAGVFREQFSEDIGAFFDKMQLGRSMARVDWNRDGREDVVISSIGTPAALVTNTSDATGQFLAVRLIGTAANRDGIGSVVRVRDGDWVRTQQLTAGDGYMSSNERRLVFGLGDRNNVPELQIRWLDGSTSKFENLSAGQEIIVRQGEQRVLSAPR